MFVKDASPPFALIFSPDNL